MPALEANSAREWTNLSFYPWSDEAGLDDGLRTQLVDFGAKGFSNLVPDDCMRQDKVALITDPLPAVTCQFTASTIVRCKCVRKTANTPRRNRMRVRRMGLYWPLGTSHA